MVRILFVLLGLCISGCSSVKTTSVTYHGENSLQRGAIIVFPYEPSYKNSLEFNSIRKRVNYYLKNNGYTITDNLKNAQFVAFVNYMIDKGKTIYSEKPIVVQTGGGKSHSDGTIIGYGGMATYSEDTYTPPIYSFVGIERTQDTIYKRYVRIDIFKFDGKKLQNKLYEIKAVSDGSGSNINRLVHTIIDAMFSNFPGEDGKFYDVQSTYDIDWSMIF